MELETVKSERKNFHPHLPLLLLHGNPWVAHVAGAGDVEPRLAHPHLLLFRHHGPPGAAHCRPRARPTSSTGAPESLLIFRESCNLTFSQKRRSTSVTTLVTITASPMQRIQNMKEMEKLKRARTQAELHLILNWESLFCFRPSVVGVRHADSSHT